MDMFDLASTTGADYLSDTQTALGLSDPAAALLAFVTAADPTDYVGWLVVGRMSANYRSNPSVRQSVLALGGDPAKLAGCEPPYVYGLIGRRSASSSGGLLSEALGMNTVSVRTDIEYKKSTTLRQELSMVAESGAASCGSFGRINVLLKQIRVPSNRLVSFTIISRDRWGNPNSQQEDAWAISFSPSVLAEPEHCGDGFCDPEAETCVTCHTDCKLADCAGYTSRENGYYTMGFIAQRSGQYIMDCAVTDAKLNGSPLLVTVMPGPACLNNTVFSGLGWSRATAGETAAVSVTLRDCSDNPIQFDNPRDVLRGQLRPSRRFPGNGVTVEMEFAWRDCNALGEACTLVALYTPFQASEFQTREFELWMEINGEAGFVGPDTGTQVSAGQFDPAQSDDLDCTIGNVLFAGLYFQCTIQSRDKWGNSRDSPNPPGLEWSAFFSPPVASSQLVYFAHGETVLRFVPSTAGPLSVSISAGPAGPTAPPLATSPLNYLVKSGVAATRSELGSGGTLPAQPGPDVVMVAGEWAKFQLTSYDLFGNLRRDGVARDDDYNFALSMSTPLVYNGIVCVCGAACPDLDRSVQRSPCISNHSTSGVFTVEYRMAHPVGRYTLDVRVALSNLDVIGDPASAQRSAVSPYDAIVLVPGPTNPADTELSGPGLASCVDQQPSSFRLTAFDRFANRQAGHMDLAFWTVQLAFLDQSGQTQIRTSATLPDGGNWQDLINISIPTDGSPGTYMVFFTCPPFNQIPEGNVFTFSIAHPAHTQPGPFATRQGLMSTWGATTSWALFNGWELPALAGENVRWYIHDYKDVAHQVDRTDSLAFTLELADQPGTQVLRNIRARQNSSHPWLWTFEFVPQVVGVFSAKVFFNAAYETKASQAGDYVNNIVLGPGQVDVSQSGAVSPNASGWQVRAGHVGVLDIVLRDRYRHEIKDPARTVLTHFTAFLPWLDPAGGMDTGSYPDPHDPQATLQAVWNASKQKFQVGFNITRAGTWTAMIYETVSSGNGGGGPRYFQASTANGRVEILPVDLVCEKSFVTVDTAPGGQSTTAGQARVATLTLLDRYYNRVSAAAVQSQLPRPLRVMLANSTNSWQVPHTEIPSESLPSNLMLRYVPANSPEPPTLHLRVFAAPATGSIGCELGTDNGLAKRLPGEENMYEIDYQAKPSKLSPYNISVTPAAFELSKTQVDCLNCPVIAGKAMRIRVQTMDQYGNAWLTLPNRVTYELLTPLTVSALFACAGTYKLAGDPQSPTGGYVCTPHAPGTNRGTYELVIFREYTHRAWVNYTVLLKVIDPNYGSEYSMTIGPFGVQAGPADADSALLRGTSASPTGAGYMGLWPSGFAGSYLTFTLTTRDQHGNRRIGARDDVHLSPEFLIGRLVCPGTEEYDDAPVKDNLLPGTSFFNILPGNSTTSPLFNYVGDGTYTIAFLPRVTGLFTFNFTQRLSDESAVVAGRPTSPSCLTMSPWVQRVCMGPVDPTTTSVKIFTQPPTKKMLGDKRPDQTPLNITAGDRVWVAVEGADSYGNVAKRTPADCPNPSSALHAGAMPILPGGSGGAPQCDANYWRPDKKLCNASDPQFIDTIDPALTVDSWATNNSGGVTILGSASEGVATLEIRFTQARQHVIVISLADGAMGFWALPLMARSIIQVGVNTPASFLLRNKDGHEIARPVMARYEPLGRAGYVGNVYISTIDAFGNEIRQFADESVSSFNYSAVLAKPGYQTLTQLALYSGDQDLHKGRWVLSFFSFWPGQFYCQIALHFPAIPPFIHQDDFPEKTQENVQQYLQLNTSILPFDCVSIDPTKPISCANGECVAKYTDCSNLMFEAGRTPEEIATTQPCAPVSQDLDLNLNTSAIMFIKVGKEFCPCPAGLTHCAGGYCSRDCGLNLPCPTGLVACPVPGRTSRTFSPLCRKVLADCPSPRVCPPGWLLCYDDRTCVQDATKCPALSLFQSACPEPQILQLSELGGKVPAGLSGLTFRCASGDCVAHPEGCPTDITCPGSSQVVCPDGQCVDSRDQCVNILPCLALITDFNTFRCRDGSCRASLLDCGTGLTCRPGQVKCANGLCQDSLEKCGPALSCPPGRVRCAADGSCAVVSITCPSTSSCPVNQPVLCPDGGNCRDVLDNCPTKVMECPDYTCPDRSCAPDARACPTVASCSPIFPVLCGYTDSRCSPLRILCPEHTPCPNSLPLRCADGSCRRNHFDCPSRIQCPKDHPILCTDNSCRQGLCPLPPLSVYQECPKAGYPADWTYRCSSGECALGWQLCPTRVTCDYGLIRCWDGTCRFPGLCLAKVSVCRPPLVPCPLVSAGVPPCVQPGDIASCPTSIVCPVGYVRCLDSSCARGIADCPPAPPAYPDYSLKQPCPDGTWASSARTCGSASTCTQDSPFKCFDGTCRRSPADCPPNMPCEPDAENGLPRYLCPSGSCTEAVYSAQCTFESVACLPPRSVKCQDGNCVERFSDCPPAQCSVLSGETAGSELDLATCSNCPSGWTYCPDGSCRGEAASCPTPACPAHFPFRCQDGLCAPSLDWCNTNEGCPASAPVLCLESGSCAINANECIWEAEGLDLECPRMCQTEDDLELLPPGYTCEQFLEATRYDELKCDDGSCGTESTCPNFRGCMEENEVRCLDGSCEAISRDPSVVNNNNRRKDIDPNQQGDPNLCMHAYTCPPSAPVRCPDGFCAYWSGGCPAPADFLTCPTDRPFLCAIGTCVLGPEMCPSVKPCGSEEERCGNGLCRPLGKCPPARTCPLSHRRCRSGLCVYNDLSCTPDWLAGCPVGFAKCRSGQCINTTIQTCQHLNPTGCPPATPHRCQVDGSCADTPEKCPEPSGCAKGEVRCTETTGWCVAERDYPAACEVECPTPHVRCATGSCRASFKDCRGLNLCPLDRPVRCVDGTCRAQPAGSGNVGGGGGGEDTCQPAVSCNLNETLCYDGSCALGPCVTVLACPFPLQMCIRDWTCRLPAHCNETVALQCPLASPVLCPSGRCVTDATDCGACPYGGGVKLCAGAPSCPPDRPSLCFDGGCAPSAADCAARRTMVNQHSTIHTLEQALELLMVADANIAACSVPTPPPPQPPPPTPSTPAGSTTPTTTTTNATAATATAHRVVCGDGACVTDPRVCHVIPPCPVNSYRCKDGRCGTRKECEERNKALPPCAGSPPLHRCEDGLCRTNCLQYDGCGSRPQTTDGLARPFHCSNRECGIDEDECEILATGETWRARRRVTSKSLQQQDAVNPDTGEPQTYTPQLPCLSNQFGPCRNSVKIRPFDLTVSNAVSARLDLCPDTLMQLHIPVGALQLHPAVVSPATLSLRPVGESVMRNALNVVHPSRRRNDVFDYPPLMSFAQTVVSPAFECSVSPEVKQPFAVNLTISADVDDARMDPAGHWIEDVCLARLVRVKGVSWWLCLYSGEERRIFCPETVDTDCTMGAKIPRNPATSPPPPFRVVSSFNRCVQTAREAGEVGVGQPLVYAFITAPLLSQKIPPPPPRDWVQENMVYIVLAIVGACFLIFVMVFIAGRLRRYLDKHRYAKREKLEAAGNFANVQAFGILAGKDDVDVLYFDNPLTPAPQQIYRQPDPEELDEYQRETETKVDDTHVRQAHLERKKQQLAELIKAKEKLEKDVNLSIKTSDLGPTMEEDERLKWASVGPRTSEGEDELNNALADSEEASLLPPQHPHEPMRSSAGKVGRIVAHSRNSPPVSREEFLHEVSLFSNGTRASSLTKLQQRRREDLDHSTSSQTSSVEQSPHLRGERLQSEPQPLLMSSSNSLPPMVERVGARRSSLYGDEGGQRRSKSPPRHGLLASLHDQEHSVPSAPSPLLNNTAAPPFAVSAFRSSSYPRLSPSSSPSSSSSSSSPASSAASRLDNSQPESLATKPFHHLPSSLASPAALGLTRSRSGSKRRRTTPGGGVSSSLPGPSPQTGSKKAMRAGSSRRAGADSHLSGKGKGKGNGNGKPDAAS
eukprot:g10196.t1